MRWCVASVFPESVCLISPQRNMNAYKKLHTKWHVELKQHFHDILGDIPYCENCNSTKPPLDMAHSRKRFDIHTREEYFHAAMLCRACHNSFELGKTHQEMFELVSEVINKR